jgi:hypothetical protein
VKELLADLGRARDPSPEFVEMENGAGRVVLVLANKKDAYYVTTTRASPALPRPSALARPASRPSEQVRRGLRGTRG